MASENPIQYYGLKDFSNFVKEEGMTYSTRELSVYKSRELLPDPTVLIGKRAGWTKEQIDDWIVEVKLSGMRNYKK